MSDPGPEEPQPVDRGRLYERADVADDPAFLARVRQAIVAAAIAVSNEPDTTELHEQRVALASSVLMFPHDWSRRMAYALANNPNVGTGSSDPSAESDDGDNALEYVVTTVWDAFALTFPAPPEAADGDVG